MFTIQSAVNSTGKATGKNSETKDFEAAALPYLNDLYRTAAHMAGSRSEAEDLVQEVYMQAWKSFHRFELGTNCRAWLYKILFNKLNHHRRRWFKLKTTTDNTGLLNETLRYQPPVPEHLQDEEILSALKKLPLCYRDAVLLADVQEYSYAEIADILEIPIGTVMSRLSRGRKLLRLELGSVAESYGIRISKIESVGTLKVA